MSQNRITKIVNSFTETVSRYPLTVLLSVLGSYIWLKISYLDYSDPNPYDELLYAISLGIPISFAFYTIKESNLFKIPPFVTELLCLILITGYYFTIYDVSNFDRTIHPMRYLGLSFAAHLLVAFSGFITSSNQLRFWKFNQILFVNILTAILFSLTLWAGVAVAILALDQLLELDIDGELYYRVFIVIAGVFNTIFFLSRAPKKDEDILETHPYPKVLKVFATYILLPLTTLYIIILYLYIGKILIQWELPKGWVSWLVISFSVTGILSFLLVYPYRDDEDNRWLMGYTKGFYWSLFPLIIMLFISIGVRISDYGITESRYIVLAIAIWLLFIAIYSLVTKGNKIKAIPISLFIFSTVSFVGPQSAFNVSDISQKARFKAILERNDMLKDGMITEAKEEIEPDDHFEMINILSYFIKKNRLEKVLVFYPEKVQEHYKLEAETERYFYLRDMDKMELVSQYTHNEAYYREDYTSITKRDEEPLDADDLPTEYNLNYSNAIDISGYDMADIITTGNPNSLFIDNFPSVMYRGGYNIEFICDGVQFDFQNENDSMLSTAIRGYLKKHPQRLGFRPMDKPFELVKTKKLNDGSTMTIKIIVTHTTFYYTKKTEELDLKSTRAWVLVKQE